MQKKNKRTKTKKTSQVSTLRKMNQLNKKKRFFHAGTTLLDPFWILLISGSGQWQQHQRQDPIFEVTGGLFCFSRQTFGPFQVRWKQTSATFLRIWSDHSWSDSVIWSWKFLVPWNDHLPTTAGLSGLAHLNRCHRTATQDEPWEVCGS